MILSETLLHTSPPQLPGQVENRSEKLRDSKDLGFISDNPGRLLDEVIVERRRHSDWTGKDRAIVDEAVVSLTLEDGGNAESGVVHHVVLADGDSVCKFWEGSEVPGPDEASTTGDHVGKAGAVVGKGIVVGVGHVHPAVHVALDTEYIVSRMYAYMNEADVNTHSWDTFSSNVILVTKSSTRVSTSAFASL
jgi:hypothetical protein